MPLARIRVYRDGDVVVTVPLDAEDTAPVRYDGEVEVPLPDADTFLVVRVDPAGPGTPVLGLPDGSFTNPLFVVGRN
jgi:hypothetical protein